MVKVAIAGAGGIARRHLDCLKAIPAVEIVAVTDVIPEKAQAMAAACGATAYRDVEPCLENADALYILTPPSTHKDLAVAAAQAGKHVFMEKPISISIADAETIIEATRQANVKLMLAFNMRFRKGGLAFKDILASGALGKVYNFWIHRMGPLGVSANNWRVDPTLLSGVAIESMSHDIDQIRWLAGEVKDVRATVFESRSDLPGYDTDINAALTLVNGTMAGLHVSWASPLGHNARGLIGTTGSTMIDGPNMWDWQFLHTKTTEMADENISVINDMLSTTGSYLEESKHFIQCIENNQELAITGEDGLKALQVSHAILRSSHEGIVVKLV
jgi:predicted dehydrogenase